ncbi:MSCRAMM family protein [Streptomyces sp. NPDC055025]
MRISPARRLPAAVAVAAAVTSTLTWAPAATAQSSEPTPSTSTDPSKSTEPDAGSVVIVKKDPADDVLAGAAFLLLDATGQEAGSGATDAQGQLEFTDLAVGVYRLKETASGSPFHDVVADQDVIVTPGATARLTIVDPFKPADLTVKTTDKNSGKPLPGAVINITPTGGNGDTVSLTTGKNGTATAHLPVTSRTGTPYTATETKAPASYRLDSKPVKFSANPGSPVTVTLTNTKKEQPAKPPTTQPTSPPATTPASPPHQHTPPKSGGNESNKTPSPSSSDPGTPASDETTANTGSPAPQGSLAHTGTDATPWLLGSASLLLAVGSAALFTARRRHDKIETSES